MATLAEMLSAVSQQHHDKMAFWETGNHYSYGQFLDRVQRAAGALQQRGLRTGERFAVIAPNCIDAAVLLYAGYWSGTVPVPLNIRLAPPEIRYMLDDCEVKYLFIDDSLADLLNNDSLSSWKESAIYMGPKGKSRSFETFINEAERYHGPKQGCATEPPQCIIKCFAMCTNFCTSP
jgi:long-chain acyl-CoA synthetase